jgi:hypothetical protein
LNGFPYSHDGTFRLVAAGATDVGNIAFLVSDPSKTLDQARGAAIADARRKSEVYAQASSLQLRRVEWITEDAEFAPHGPMGAQGASVPMAVSVPIATGVGLKYVKGTQLSYGSNNPITVAVGSHLWLCRQGPRDKEPARHCIGPTIGPCLFSVRCLCDG